VDDEPIHLDEWQRTVALDRAMSELVGQLPPDPEETLDRLINQRLISHAAEQAGLLTADEADAEAWLVSFLEQAKLEETALEKSLNVVGLTRADLVGELVPRLMDVERALEALPPDGDSEAWVADLRGQARVVMFESVSTFEVAGLPAPTAAAMLTPPLSPDQPVTSLNSLPNGSSVGELAPNFTLTSTDGSMVALLDYRGQPVVLNFWAPWCAPCREALPMLDATGNDDLVVLGIAVRESPDQVSAFAAELGLALPLLIDQNGQVSDAYRVRGLPTTIFADRGGIIVARHVGPLDQETLADYLTLLLDLSPSPTRVP
jgi:thiol-disulfide isomerase/thioredoxin